MQRTMTFRSLALDAVNRAVDVRETASGKAINAARVLRTLGEPVVAVGFAGGDRGRALRQDLQETGIAHDFVEVRPQTRLCTTVIDQSAGTATELVEESAAVEPESLDRLLDVLSRHLGAADVLVMSGTLTPAAPSDFYGRCVQRAHEAGVMSIVDARGQPLREAVAAGVSVMKINQREYCDTFGQSELRHEQFLAAGLRRGVITRGAEPAIGWDEQRAWWIHVPKVAIVSPIGSGDAFAAGLSAGLARQQSFVDACRLGAACAVANAMRPVAGVVDLSDVQRLVYEVRVQSAR
jgi:tagatose 6-phosphate kinase